MNKIEKLGTGAHASEYDARTVQHSSVAMATAPLIQGGSIYTDHEHQHAVGICTAISRVQLRERQTGKKYSPEFQYLLQKKYYDLNWSEGSSILNANKVAKLYGFLPDELWTHTTEADRFLPYDQYINKIKAIPLDEILRLLKLCVDPIAGYAQVDVSDPQAIAHAIVSSPEQAGILCRYGCQKNWWMPSWLAKDIDPLRYAPETSGHAIINSLFNYADGNHMQMLANTWGNSWCLGGNAHINWDNYPMNEAWVDLLTPPVIPPFKFTLTLRMGSAGPEVRKLQEVLKITIDGGFGTKTKNAVILFQNQHSLSADGIVGAMTRAELNKLLT